MNEEHEPLFLAALEPELEVWRLAWSFPGGRPHDRMVGYLESEGSVEVFALGALRCQEYLCLHTSAQPHLGGGLMDGQ